MDFLIGSGRVGRLHYFGINLAIVLTSIVSLLLLIDVDEFTGQAEVNPLVLVIVPVTVWLNFTNTLRRLHDCGYSGWWLLLTIMPLIGWAFSLYLLFAPGDPVRNRFGLPPGTTGAVSVDTHRQRMELLTAAAGQAYKAKTAADYLNADGSYNMDGLAADNGMAGSSHQAPTDAQLAAMPPPEHRESSFEDPTWH